jgi:succinate dehydrogenase / fumarate reductase, cytochrome b subunit
MAMIKDNSNFFSSSIGSKTIMAVTGLFLILFLVVHLCGNLQMFSGHDAVNDYAALLKSFPKLLWGMRIALITAFVLHIATSIKLSIKNRMARPITYEKNQPIRSTLASRTMLLSGLVVLSFVLFHLAHLTLGWIHPEYANLMDLQGRHHVYNMTVLGFQNIYISSFYIIAQILLCMHIGHGFSSAVQTLGLSVDSKCAILLRRFGVCFSLFIAILYVSIPASVWLGIIQTEL